MVWNVPGGSTTSWISPSGPFWYSLLFLYCEDNTWNHSVGMWLGNVT